MDGCILYSGPAQRTMTGTISIRLRCELQVEFVVTKPIDTSQSGKSIAIALGVDESVKRL